MAATTEPNSGIVYGWDLGESGWNTGMDANLLKLGRLMQCRVLDRDLATPPSTPADGDAYIVAATATDDWLGLENDIVFWDEVLSVWTNYTPSHGWTCYIIDEDVLTGFDGTAWSTGISL